MANFRGIEGACAALVSLLEDAASAPDPIGFPGASPAFELMSADDLGDISLGAAIVPYRVMVNGTYRRPAGRRDDSGQQRLTKLPVDVSVLIVVDADAVDAKLSLAGWIMRKLEDHPVMPHGLLNRDASEAFFTGESVEITTEDVAHEELLHLWEVFGQPSYTSILLPYALRNVPLESELGTAEYAAVQERLLRFGTLGDTPAAVGS